jgi:hypothetical protein
MLVGSVSTFYWLVFVVPEPERYSWWSHWGRLALIVFTIAICMLGFLISVSSLCIMLLLTADRYMGIWAGPLLFGLVVVIWTLWSQSNDP